MGEVFGPADIQAVSAALRGFERGCDEILNLLGDKRYLAPHDRDEVEELYRSLKADLKGAAKYGTLSGSRGPLSRIEQAFYDPAVRRAAIDLRPATNSNPIASHWFGAVYEARSEFSYWLHNLGELGESD